MAVGPSSAGSQSSKVRWEGADARRPPPSATADIANTDKRGRVRERANEITFSQLREKDLKMGTVVS